MSAHLVERSNSAFQKLELIPPKYPDVEVVPYNDDFIAVAPRILAAIPPSAFVFVLIDPKGWRIPLEKLSELLKRQNTEVVFNFMFDFINRFASMSEANVTAGIDELIPMAGWRDKLVRLKGEPSNDASIRSRKAILVEAFSESLANLGGYDYVAETPVLRPLKDRTLYSLIYATRKPAGIEVFRDCQIKTLREQAAVRGTTKISAKQEATGQTEMFGNLAEMAPDETDRFLIEQRAAAEAALLLEVPYGPNSTAYGEIWPKILSKHAIRKTELGAIVAKLRKQGALSLSEWPARKRTAEDSYKLSRSET
jgi:three-Cys-motif partner protein